MEGGRLRLQCELLDDGAPMIVTLKNFWPRQKHGAGTAEWDRQVTAAKTALDGLCTGLELRHLMANTTREVTLFGRRAPRSGVSNAICGK